MIILTDCFSAKLKNLAHIRHFVNDAANSLGADPHSVLDLVQAVDEAATNIIVHGYAGRPGVIEVTIERQKDLMVIAMRDQAPGFDPTRVPPPDLTLPLEKRPVGGLGIFLIRRSVDELQHHFLPSGGNELILIKRLAVRDSPYPIGKTC